MARSKKDSFVLVRTPFTGRVERKVRLLLDDRVRPERGTRVVVAVSGGPDSSALAVTMSRLGGRYGLELTIAHFDHMLRGRGESQADVKYVARLAEELGVRLIRGSGDTAARSRELKTSREDAARRLRYAFLGEVAQETGSGAVAVGHTIDDRAETVLLHILRGSGLSGIASMGPVGVWPFAEVGPALWRPLLGLRREETVRYCREVGLDPREDETNRLPVATRNVVRSVLLPAMREFNPRIEEALARLGEAAELDADFLELEADRAYKEVARRYRGGVRLSSEGLAAMHRALQHRVIVRAAREAGATGTVQALHITQVARLLEGGGSAPLPGGVLAEVRGGVLWIRRDGRVVR